MRAQGGGLLPEPPYQTNNRNPITTNTLILLPTITPPAPREGDANNVGAGFKPAPTNQTTKTPSPPQTFPSPARGRVRNCFRSEVTTAFGRVGARICSIPGRSGWFQTCLPAVGRAKRRARPMRAYARAGPSDSFTALTMLYAMLLSSSSVSPLASPV